MILIKKEDEPKALENERCNPNVNEYSDLSSVATTAVRNNLLKEQGYLCAYCMKRLNDNSQTKIEHYIARNSGARNSGLSLDLDYKNMLGVCYGNAIEPGTPQECRTCDACKGNRTLTVNPLDQRTIKQIKYSENGEIYSDNEAINKDLNENLNLNGERTSLKVFRKSALMALKREIKSKIKDAPHETYLKYLRKYHEHYSDDRIEKKLPYVGIILWYLEERMGRH